MVGTCLLLALLLAATVTDLRWGKIYNWNTYSGILLAIAASSVASWRAIDTLAAAENVAEFWGIVPVGDCVLGLLACGVVMLVCYVAFPGGVGGGDIKLVAMIGAFQGLYGGLESLLWTFVLGGGLALIVLVWKFGLWQLLRRSFQFLTYAWRAGPATTLSEDERRPLKAGLNLAPSAMAAVLIVRFHVMERLF